MKKNIVKKFYLIKKDLLSFNFDLKNKKLKLISNCNSKILWLTFNYLQYKGFLFQKNNFLIFRNNISLIKIVRRLNNLIKGFLRGYCLILEIIGLGFSVTNNNNVLRFNIGYNHSIFYKFTNDIRICSKRKLLFLFSYSFFILKNVVVDIKNFRKLNVYKLKGIKDKNELYNKKNWKKKIS